VNDDDNTYTTTWPDGGFNGDPSTWGEISSSDNWRKVGVEEGKVRLHLTLTPINPKQITYSLSKGGWFIISLHEITGRLSKQLVNCYKKIGSHSVKLDNLSSGIYFLKFTHEGKVLTSTKLIIIK